MADDKSKTKTDDLTGGSKPGMVKGPEERKGDAEAMKQDPALLGNSIEPPYDRLAEDKLPPRDQSGNITSREAEMARAKAAGRPYVQPVADGTRPGESSDPAVHQLLGDMQAARDAGDQVAVDRLNDLLREANYAV